MPKISEFPELTVPTLADLMATVNAATTKKISLSNLLAGISLANLGTRSAGDLNSGTLADARLSSKVPLDDVAEIISGVWDFANGHKEYGRSFKMGDWVDVAYNGADYTAGGSMTWTVESGDQLQRRYTRIGNTLFYVVTIGTSTLGGTASSTLFVTLPAGLTVGGGAGGAAIYVGHAYNFNAGAWDVGSVDATEGATTIRILNRTVTNFTLETNLFNARAEIAVEVTG